MNCFQFKARWLVLIMLLSSGTEALSALELESGPGKVTLIELYTSEGCSSCPPADRWLSGLAEHEKLWNKFVPIALHVDYWDHIGWKDRFAHRDFSQRQRRYANELDEATVYTPGVRAHGQEWRRWWSNRLSGVLSNAEAGNLRFRLDEGTNFEATYKSKDKRVKPLVLNIAVLGMGLQSEVSRGENKGRTLSHDFVVLGLHRVAAESPGSWSGTLPEPSVRAGRHAVAVWVSEGQSQIPLQTVGGYLPDGSFQAGDQVSH